MVHAQKKNCKKHQWRLTVNPRRGLLASKVRAVRRDERLAWTASALAPGLQSSCTNRQDAEPNCAGRSLLQCCERGQPSIAVENVSEKRPVEERGEPERKTGFGIRKSLP